MMLGFIVYMYLMVGLIINTGYFSANKKEFVTLTDTQLTINFLVTWLFWIIVYSLELLKTFVIYITRKGI